MYKNKIKTVILLSISLFLASCGEDRRSEVEKLQDIQTWIYAEMDKWYYWNESIPNKDNLNFFEEPTKFFAGLLSPLDGRNKVPFSYIEKSITSQTRSISQTEYSHGFDFVFATINNSREYVAVVTYTAANSPASEAGLTRGDIITQIDNQPINQTNVLSLIGGPQKTLNIYRGQQELRLTLNDARAIEDNPVYEVKKFNNNTIGYLMYNHFTVGKNDKYNNSLRDASTQLKGVDKLILDLRYNNGGAISSAELLMSLICPKETLDKTVGYTEYNKTINKKNDITTSSKLLKHGTNLDIKELYVLTSQSTASASEFIINSLRLYVPVYVIGDVTVGKNVGSIGFDKNEWHIQPIVCKIFNHEMQSDYEEGFTPGYYYTTTTQKRDDYKVRESLPFANIGSEYDPLIRKALQLASSTGSNTRTVEKTHELNINAFSADLKRSNTLLINK